MEEKLPAPERRTGPENPFFAKHTKTLSDESRVEIANIAIRAYLDDFDMSADKKKTAGALYYIRSTWINHSGLVPSQVLISSVATDDAESDAVLRSSLRNLVEVENVGKLMSAVEGRKCVFVKMYGLALDFV